MADIVYDFSDCFVFPVNNYSGADIKERIKFQGENYLMKFRRTSRQKNGLTSLYTNNIFSEYIGCHIIETLNIPVQKTFLGVYKGEYVVACKDFTSAGIHSSEFADLSNSFISKSKIKPHPELDSVLKCYEERFNADSSHPFRKAFWDLFIIDALLGNFDRHAGNWGFLVDEKTGETFLSPIYDCGSCLYPGLGDHSLKDIISSSTEIETRIFDFPSSSILNNGEKISYFNFISSLENTECNEALFRIFPKISLEKINDVIDNTPIISDIRKQFYKTMLSQRYYKILDFAYEKAKMKGLVLNDKKSNLDTRISLAKESVNKPNDFENNLNLKNEHLPTR